MAPWLASQLQVRVVCVDLLGHGLSESAAEQTEHSFVADLLGMLHGVDRVHVCATSVSCKIGVLLAQELGNRMGQLIMSACTVGSIMSEGVVRGFESFLSQV